MSRSKWIAFTLTVAICFGFAAWAQHGPGFEETITHISESNMQANIWSLIMQLGGLGFAGAGLAFIVRVSRQLGEHMAIVARAVKDQHETRAIVDEHETRISRVEGRSRGE